MNSLVEKDNLWGEILSSLKQTISSQYVNTWLEPVEFISFENDELSLQVSNKFQRDWIKDHYQDVIEKLCNQLTGKNVSITFQIKETLGANVDKQVSAPTKRQKKKQTKSSVLGSPLVEKYTFENFIVGPSYQFAHAACVACAQKPGECYNPLFIYGGAGLGKTHLLNAIGHKVIQTRPDLRIHYTTAERFMNELINSIKLQKMHEFRLKYRDSCDVLLIDDIHSIAGKERTQEEFFHTFNTLHESKKQIVMTSDKFPKDIDRLENRLKTRFEWGLIADIKAPEIETRLAILEKKAELEHLNITREVSLFLANNITDNVRELEGSLIRLAAYSSLTGRDLSIELAKDVLKNVIVSKDKTITADDIQKVVSNFFNITIQDLRSSRRKKIVVLPRQIAMYLTRKYSKLSFPDIGDKFGGKDHTTIMHACKKLENKILIDSNLKNIIESIEKNLIS